MGDADALISGLTMHYPDTIRPALQVIKVREGLSKVSGLHLLITPKGDLYFLADTTVNIEPTAEDLAEIALETAAVARRFDVEPRVAMLSFFNFGSTRHPLADKVRRGEGGDRMCLGPGDVSRTGPVCQEPRLGSFPHVWGRVEPRQS